MVQISKQFVFAALVAAPVLAAPFPKVDEASRLVFNTRMGRGNSLTRMMPDGRMVYRDLSEASTLTLGLHPNPDARTPRIPW